jgi:4-amino-4-deoxy-L-arabinose transferase-like glycosyltransferase
LWLILVLGLIAGLSVPYDLGRQDVVNINEVQRLLPALEMRERADWVVPTIDGDPYLAKPPLIHWIVGAAYWVSRSDSPLAGRGAVAVICLLVAWGVLAIGWREAGPRVGLWSAIILLSAYFFRQRAQEVEIDPVLTAAVFGLVVWQWRAVTTTRWVAPAIASGLFAGAALLLKGPVVAPFVAASTLAILAVERPPGRRLAASLGILLGLGVASTLGVLRGQRRSE